MFILTIPDLHVLVLGLGAIALLAWIVSVSTNARRNSDVGGFYFHSSHRGESDRPGGYDGGWSGGDGGD